MTLKQVKMICALCRSIGVAQIDTTENVVLMVCICPNCGFRVEEKDDEKQASLAELFG